MSTEVKKESVLWSYIGKIGILVGVIWGAIQIYNYAFKTEDYQSEVTGNHSFYETSPIHKQNYNKALRYKALVKTIITNEGSLKSYKLDTLLVKIKTSKNWVLKSDFDVNLSELNNNSPLEEDSNYNEIWSFNIKNTGNKPFEELSLELPFEGNYKIILPNNITKTGDFKNKIEIGELRSSYEAKVICWTNNLGYQSDQDEDKSRFTHKYGWFNIKYPVQVAGLYAWNKKYDDFPILIISILILSLIFSFGVTIGVKSYKEELNKKTESEGEK